MKEDLELMKKTLFENNGVMPSDVDDQDYFEFLTMLKAREKDKRPGDPMALVKRLRGGK